MKKQLILIAVLALTFFVTADAHAEDFRATDIIGCVYVDDDADRNEDGEYDPEDYSFLFSSRRYFIDGLFNGHEGLEINDEKVTDPDDMPLDPVGDFGDLGDEDNPVDFSYGGWKLGLKYDYEINDDFLADSYDDEDDAFKFKLSVLGSFTTTFTHDFEIPRDDMGTCVSFETTDSDPVFIDLNVEEATINTFLGTIVIGGQGSDSNDSDNTDESNSESTGTSSSNNSDNTIQVPNCSLVTGAASSSPVASVFSVGILGLWILRMITKWLEE